MKRRKKLFLLLVLSVILIIGMNLTVYAANSYIINGKTVSYTDFSSSPNECWEYANLIYNKIWGQRFTNAFSDSNNSLRNLSDSQLTLTPAHLKAYVTNAKVGSVLRICNSAYLHGTDGWGHSQIIVQKDANGFTVFQGGLSSAPYKNEKYYTWNEYCSTGWLGGTYQYIKYIKWPGASAYGGTDTTPPTVSNHKVSNLSKDGFKVSCTVSDNVAVSYVDFLIWPDANGNWNPTYQRATISGSTASCYVKTSEHHEYEGNYAVHLQAYDTSGNMTYSQFNWIYVDKTGPVTSDYKVSDKTSEGFKVSCTVKDNKKLAYVDFLVWPNEKGEWKPTYHRAVITGNTASYYVKVSEHHNYYGNYAVHLQAYDESGNMTYGYFDWINVKKGNTSNPAIEKKSQTISANSFIKTVGNKVFSIAAKTSGNGKLTYKSSNSKIATVSSNGKVAIKGAGIVTITIKASETSTYKAATKQITVTVKPKTVKISSLSNKKSKKLVVKWQRNSGVSGYQIQYSTNSGFSGAKTMTIRSNKTLSKTLPVIKGKIYYVRIRTYKGNLYSAWSSSKKLKIIK